MSEERTVASGERRIERIRAERGMPVRRAPIAAGALVGGAFGAWAAEMPVRLLGEVRGEREAEVVGLFIGDGTLVGAGLDLVEQNISSPSEAGCGLKIPKTG